MSSLARRAWIIARLPYFIREAVYQREHRMEQQHPGTALWREGQAEGRVTWAELEALRAPGDGDVDP
jgi:hypothetical protein